jgi:hypothetical protein
MIVEYVARRKASVLPFLFIGGVEARNSDNR